MLKSYLEFIKESTNYIDTKFKESSAEWDRLCKERGEVEEEFQKMKRGYWNPDDPRFPTAKDYNDHYAMLKKKSDKLFKEKLLLLYNPMLIHSLFASLGMKKRDYALKKKKYSFVIEIKNYSISREEIETKLREHGFILSKDLHEAETVASIDMKKPYNGKGYPIYVEAYFDGVPREDDPGSKLTEKNRKDFIEYRKKHQIGGKEYYASKAGVDKYDL